MNEDPPDYSALWEECSVHGRKLKGSSCSGYGETLIKDYPPLVGSRETVRIEAEHHTIQKVPG